MIILRQKQFGWFWDFVDWANKKADPNWKTEKNFPKKPSILPDILFYTDQGLLIKTE